MCGGRGGAGGRGGWGGEGGKGGHSVGNRSSRIYLPDNMTNASIIIVSLGR